MQILWSWLQNHGCWNVDPEGAAQALTFSGTETEVAPAYPWADAVQVAYVRSVQPHPDANRLKVCEVQIDPTRTVSIVCGATNVRAGMYTMVALPGCLLPGQSKPLEISLLRGVTSHGMLCSAKELAMEDVWGDADGLVELDATARVVGQSLREFLPREDALLILNVTPNRGDLLSHRGVARELIALGRGTELSRNASRHELWSRSAASLEDSISSLKQTSLLTIQTPACSLACLGRLEQLVACSTPALIRRRLAATNSSWHHPCVDWTNYMAQDDGQPLHVYDADEVRGDVTIRLSRSGESFDALNGHTYTLNDQVVVVADDAGVLSVAGIMGGVRARCVPESSRILLESAYFDPSVIARAGQALGIHSASRSRFERGVDPLGVRRAFCNSLAWITENTQSRVTAWTEQGIPPVPSVIAFRPQDVVKRCGVVLEPQVVEQRLQALGAQIQEQGTDQWQITPPSWRHDWRQSWDCVNEVVRGSGYQEVPVIPWAAPSIRSQTVVDTSTCLLPLDYRWIQKMRQWWIAQGVFEAVTWSFVSEDKARPFVAHDDELRPLKIANPLSTDTSVLRPRVLASLYGLVEHHRRHRVAWAPFFEIGPCFKGLEPKDQSERVAIIWPVQRDEMWQAQSNQVVRPWSFYDLKDLVQRCVFAMGLEWERCFWESTQEEGFHPGQCASVWYETEETGRVCLGIVGASHPQWASDVLMAELLLNQWPRPHDSGFYPIPTLQTMRKDVSFFVPKHTEIGTVIRTMTKDIPQLSHVHLIDVYRGANDVVLSPEEGAGPEQGDEQYVEGRLSVTLACYFQPTENAFTATDIHDFLLRVVESVKPYQWVLRGTLQSL